MPLSVGAKLRSYEILALIGKGGMGEVYRARDMTLKREVALKVLPAAFSNNLERMARFQREAEVLASLNHPSIGHIYGIVETDGTRALVLALIEGPTLEDRIKAGPLPAEEVVAISKQVIEALEYAHDRGVIHRDLKPANIKITSEGDVKVLDFGLAKVLEDEPPPSSPSNSPTLTLGHTRSGVILGTAAYMSPEQAVGRSVDRRSDIFSFGSVLYEMLTGKRAFTGATTPDVLEAVVKNDPDWSMLPAGTPAYLRRLLERMLAKDRRQRLQAIGEARIAIQNSGKELDAAAAPVQKVQSALPWAMAATAILMAAGIGFVHFREAARDERVLRFSIAPPANTLMGFLAISPDGRRLVAGVFNNSRGQLWLRSLDSQQFQPLSGTDNARSPFWSADSRFIGFFADGRLKTVPATGGPAQTLCGETGLGNGGAWNRDGVILFGSETGPLRRVSAGGGECVPVTKADQTMRDEYPEFLPDGKHFLYFHGLPNDESLRGVYVATLDNPNGRKVLPDNSNALFAPAAAGERNGHLLFVREGNLMAQSFDAGALETVGDPFLVAGQASPSLTPPGVAASLSSNGTLVYLANRSTETQLTWFDRSGEELGKLTPKRTPISGILPIPARPKASRSSFSPRMRWKARDSCLRMGIGSPTCPMKLAGRRCTCAPSLPGLANGGFR